MYGYTDESSYIKGISTDGNSVTIIISSDQESLFSVSNEGEVFNISSDQRDVLYCVDNSCMVVAIDKFSKLEVEGQVVKLTDVKRNSNLSTNFESNMILFAMTGVILLCLLFMKKSFR